LLQTRPSESSDPINMTKNDRRRRMEPILVMLAEPGTRSYIAELEKVGLLPVKRCPLNPAPAH
jgi:hypothetical protein